MQSNTVITLALPLSNAFLVPGERWTLVDAGAPGDERAILRALARHGIAPGDIGLILLTHGHVDHFGAAAALRAATRAPVAVHQADAAFVRAGRNPEIAPNDFEGRLFRPFLPWSAPPLEPDIVFDTTFDPRPYGLGGEIIPLPGHSAGSVGVLLPDGALIAGDLLRGGYLGGRIRPHLPLPPFFLEDQAALRRSVERALALPLTRIYVGHGGPLSPADVRDRLERGVLLAPAMSGAVSEPSTAHAATGRVRGDGLARRTNRTRERPLTIRKMHTDEVATDAAIVRRLLAEQFPHWAELPLRPVPSAGTDNAIYRLGDEMSVRLPRIHWAVGQVAKEREWLPKLAPHLPLMLPVQLAVGAPAEGYPYQWAVYEWLPGQNAQLGQLADPEQAARDLADFIRALQRIDTSGGPHAAEHNLRGVPLHTRDAATRQALAELHGMFDAAQSIAVWEQALRAPEWDRAPVWFHGDLLPGNLLFQEGRLHAVIDWSGLGVGDPAPDLMSAWHLFSGQSRAAFRHALGVDDATWARGRGHALSQAVIFIPYYLATNPVGVAQARRAVEQILAEAAHQSMVRRA